MPMPLAKTLFAAIVLMASFSNLKAQYVDAYNKSGTGPNPDRTRQEAANREAVKLQEKLRREQNEANRNVTNNNRPSNTTSAAEAKKSSDKKYRNPKKADGILFQLSSTDWQKPHLMASMDM